MALRRAVLADAPGIAHTHVAAWRAGCRGLIPDHYLAALDVGAGETKWREALESPPAPAYAVLVAEAGGAIDGFAVAAASRDADAAAQTGELWSLYVRPERWGRGLGRALLQAAEGWLAESGFTAATLWVLSGNTRARRLYESHGWIPDGRAKQRERGGRAVDEARYGKSWGDVRRSAAGPARRPTS